MDKNFGACPGSRQSFVMDKVFVMDEVSERKPSPLRNPQMVFTV